LVNYKYEQDLIDNGLNRIAGVDEVGCGPLAGPVVAACIVLSESTPLEGIDDSKKKSAKARNEIFERLKTNSALGLGIVWPEEIDEINIYQARIKAMREAVFNLNPLPEHVLVDGSIKLELSDISYTNVINGDAVSVSIAAASIMAKVIRDKIMEVYDVDYPEYGFVSHKGYGTKRHYEALAEYGPTEIHRRSFNLKSNRYTA